MRRVSGTVGPISDWGKGVGKSTYPHFNYKIGKEQGHLFLGNKIQNKGMWDKFVKEVLKAG